MKHNEWAALMSGLNIKNENDADKMYEYLLARFPKSEDIRVMLVQVLFEDRTLTDMVEWLKREIFGSD